MNYQKLFDYISQNYDINLIESEMQEICNIVNEIQGEANECQNKEIDSVKSDISDLSTPFGESIKLLKDLADLQNGAPLEQHRKEWEETMEKVYDFLSKWESQ